MASKATPSSVSNVSAAKPKAVGCIYYAPLGTTIPTNATDNLDDKFVNLGYIGKDGIENELKEENAAIQAFGGDTVLVTRTSTEEKFHYTLIEALRDDVLKQVYGTDSVTGSLADGLTVKHVSKERPHGVYVIETVLRDNHVKRQVIADGQVVSVENVSYKDDEAIGYKCELSAFPNADGVRVVEYIAKAAA